MDLEQTAQLLSLILVPICCYVREGRTMVRIAVVEDEAVSRQLLADYLARFSEENDVSFDVTYFEDGGAIIGDYKPVYDIILMDIQMTHVDGMTAARAIREVDQEVVLVFITSAAQFAIHGYQVGALSYLMKPLPWFAFSQELSRCLEAVAKRRSASVLLQSGTSTHRINVTDIVYVESIKHRLDVHTVSGTYSITSSLKAMEDQLAGHDFFGQTPATSSISPTCAASPTRSAS